MTRALPPLLAALLLAGCSTDASRPSADPTPSTPPSSTTPASTSSSPSASTAPAPPTRVTARTLEWRLPLAAGRQALVDLGDGSVLVAGGLVAGDSSTADVARVWPATGRTRQQPALAVPVHDTAGADVAGTPLVVGGGNATEQDVVQAYDAGTWRVVGHLPTTRSDLNVVGLGSKALVIGGYDGSAVPTPVLRLSRDGSTSSAGALATGVRYAAVARVGGAVYVLGGEVSGRELDTVQRVDLATGRTRVVARLPVATGHAMAAAVGGRVVLAGGRTAPDVQTRTVWLFDPTTARFTRAGTLPSALSDSAVWASGRHVWLLGGESPAVTDRVVELTAR